MLVAPFMQLSAADRYPAQRPPPVHVEAQRAIRFDCSPVTFQASWCRD
ncbi:MAG: hypothetical protein J2P17_13390 [Mycobacterium sp.]|nr:hypothetical protein [Mycobacterium sp.]